MVLYSDLRGHPFGEMMLHPSDLPLIILKKSIDSIWAKGPKLSQHLARTFIKTMFERKRLLFAAMMDICVPLGPQDRQGKLGG